ncbi:MAG: RNA polymerase sigma factor [Polyangiaceae bacterium]
MFANPGRSPVRGAELTLWPRFGDIAGVLAKAAMVEPHQQALPAAADLPVETARPADAGARALDEVMDRYARGEDLAFDELYRRGIPRVRGFLVRLCGDGALADDLAQEVFLRVHRARGNFAQGAAALPWILAIARNALRDHARRAQARPVIRTPGSDDQSMQLESAPDTRGDESLAAREMLDVVRRTLRELPPLQREAFVLLRFEGLTVGEAAQVLGATEGAVKIRAFRAYEALRAALNEANDPVVRPDR